VSACLFLSVSVLSLAPLSLLCSSVSLLQLSTSWLWVSPL
jgi:hypothetical protein